MSNYIFLIPLNNSFELKIIHLNDKIKIGRQTNARTIPNQGNGYFDSKVLSRQHAEIWSEASVVYIRDLKSSNGTFLNNERLSLEGVESSAVQLNPGNLLEFGIDIIGDDNKTIIHRKVSSKILIASNEHEYLECQQQISQQPQSSVSIHKCFDKLEQEIKSSKEISSNLQNISTDFNSINSSLRGQLPTNYQPSASLANNPIDVSSIQQQISHFSQQLQSQQKNYELLQSEHSTLRSKFENFDGRLRSDNVSEKEKDQQHHNDDSFDSSDDNSIATQRPKTPEPSASPEQSEQNNYSEISNQVNHSNHSNDTELPSYTELVSQNSSLATRLSTLSDEMSTMHDLQLNMSSRVDTYDSRLSALEESARGTLNWRSRWENALNAQRSTHTEELSKILSEYDRKQTHVLSKYQLKEKKSASDSGGKTYKFVGLLSIFMLGLAAYTVFSRQQ
ncbi:hypothetical protein E3P77_01691 [Wallemia ichthyophaga]|nr:hypothetical protein E3P77_01691 [Wallemia ichthyophaga]